MNPFYCADHMTCTTCVASVDPHCVYDTIQGVCVGINSVNRNASLQNVTGGVASCPIGKKLTICCAVIGTISCYRVVINIYIHGKVSIIETSQSAAG